MKYALMSYVYACQGENPDKVNLPAMCCLANELGMDAINMVGCYQYHPVEIANIVDGNGLRVLCHTVGANFATDLLAGMDFFRKNLQATVEMKASMMLLLFGGVEGISRDENFKRTVTGLSQALEYAKEVGVTLTVENFPDLTGPFVTFADMNNARISVDGLRFILDNGNCLIGQEDPVDVLKANHQNIVHMHFKDWVPATGGRPFMAKSIEGDEYTGGELGSGPFDYSLLLGAMDSVGYDGYVELEYLGALSAKQGLRNSMAALKRMKGKSDE